MRRKIDTKARKEIRELNRKLIIIIIIGVFLIIIGSYLTTYSKTETHITYLPYEDGFIPVPVSNTVKPYEKEGAVLIVIGFVLTFIGATYWINREDKTKIKEEN